MNHNQDSPRGETEAAGHARQALSKFATGVEGLDGILRGGLPEGRTTLLIGGPGAGKTVLSLEIAYRAAKAGEAALFISFEESAAAVRTNAMALGWDLKSLEANGSLALLTPDVDYGSIRAGEFNIQGLLAVVAGQAEQIGARLIFIDAIDVLMRLFESTGHQEDELYYLHDWLLEKGFTGILTIKARPGSRPVPSFPFLDFLADCVIVLDQRIVEQNTTRRLRIVKYRGSGYCDNECPFIITPDGFVLMAVSSSRMVKQSTGAVCSSGNAAFDTLLGGGFRRGSLILLAGPPGGGKTTVACTFATAAGQRQERALYVSFEEGEDSLIRGMRSSGLDLAAIADQGFLEILSIIPESTGVEEHLFQILLALDRYQPDHLVVDAISALHRLGAEGVGHDFLIRLLNICQQKGISCFCITQTPLHFSRDPARYISGEISGFGISSLVDTVVLLDYVWQDDEVFRSLMVLKSRGVRHSHKRHHFLITDHGIAIDPPVARRNQEEA